MVQATNDEHLSLDPLLGLVHAAVTSEPLGKNQLLKNGFPHAKLLISGAPRAVALQMQRYA